jgi:single-strand DNA-binding protein
MNLNKVFLVGRMTQDPEVKTTTSGQTVASFSIATNRNWTDQGGQKQEQVEFHNIVVWRKLAEIAGQYLKKGQLILVEGRIQTRNWTGQDGIKRYKTEVMAESFQMGPKAAGTGGNFSAPAAGGNKFNNQNQAAQPSNTPPQQQEDIPTIQVEDDISNIDDGEVVPF